MSSFQKVVMLAFFFLAGWPESSTAGPFSYIETVSTPYQDLDSSCAWMGERVQVVDRSEQLVAAVTTSAPDGLDGASRNADIGLAHYRRPFNEWRYELETVLKPETGHEAWAWAVSGNGRTIVWVELPLDSGPQNPGGILRIWKWDQHQQKWFEADPISLPADFHKGMFKRGVLKFTSGELVLAHPGYSYDGYVNAGAVWLYPVYSGDIQSNATIFKSPAPSSGAYFGESVFPHRDYLFIAERGTAEGVSKLHGYGDISSNRFPYVDTVTMSAYREGAHQIVAYGTSDIMAIEPSVDGRQKLNHYSFASSSGFKGPGNYPYNLPESGSADSWTMGVVRNLRRPAFGYDFPREFPFVIVNSDSGNTNPVRFITRDFSDSLALESFPGSEDFLATSRESTFKFFSKAVEGENRIKVYARDEPADWGEKWANAVVADEIVLPENGSFSQGSSAEYGLGERALDIFREGDVLVAGLTNAPRPGEESLSNLCNTSESPRGAIAVFAPMPDLDAQISVPGTVKAGESVKFVVEVVNTDPPDVRGIDGKDVRIRLDLSTSMTVDASGAGGLSCVDGRGTGKCEVRVLQKGGDDVRAYFEVATERTDTGTIDTDLILMMEGPNNNRTEKRLPGASVRIESAEESDRAGPGSVGPGLILLLVGPFVLSWKRRIRARRSHRFSDG